MEFENEHGKIYLEDGCFYFEFNQEEGSSRYRLSLTNGKVMLADDDQSLKELLLEHIAEIGDDIPYEEVYLSCYIRFEKFLLDNYVPTGSRTKPARY